MKLLVGTLYSGENEYEECLKSIRAQRYTNYDHILIENLPELDHYNRLIRFSYPLQSGHLHFSVCR